jgi:hypothetical protein
MKQGLLVIVFFLTLTKISLGVETPNNKSSTNTQFTECRVDSDCTAVVGFCYSWIPINKKFLNNKEYLENRDYDYNGAWLQCGQEFWGPGPKDPARGEFQPVTICKDNICVLTEKTTNVNTLQWIKNDRNKKYWDNFWKKWGMH